MRRYRVGTTSYIVPNEVLPNVRFLAGRVEDVELVIFELDDGHSNLLSVGEVQELATIAAAHDLSYTVHLPLDLRLGVEGDGLHRSLEKARAVIDRTRPLDPWAYVLHLDGEDAEDYEGWVARGARSLELAAEWVDAPHRLAVENLEGDPLDFLDPVMARVPASRCVDVGHLWLEGHDPAPFLQRHLARTRVVHLHGIGSRDHQSLAHMKEEQLRTVLDALDEEAFDGVLTLEVFNEEDLESSLTALREAGLSWPTD